MSYVYIVIENSDDEPEGGGIFPIAYKTFEEAKAAAIRKYKDEIARQTREIGDDSAIRDIDVPESTTGFTRLYVEKDINIYIHRLPVNMSRGRRSFSVKSNTRRRKMRKSD